MRRRVLILLAIIMVCCGVAIIHFNKKEKHYVTPIATPEKIIVYNKGTFTSIPSTDERFKKLVEIANQRTRSIDGATLNAFIKEDIKKKSILLEFDYPSENKLTYLEPRSEKEVTVTYTKLYFCLDKNSASSKVMDFEGIGSGPLGFLPPADEMIEVLNN